MVWGRICGQQWTDLIVIDGNLTAHCYLHMWTYTLLKHVLCGQIYSPSLCVVLYEITHFTPSAVVNCDIIIFGVLKNILMFIYHQIIILSKYNICINLFCVVFNTLKNN